MADIFISDDAQTLNFREICAGGIAPKILYRSSHPIKNNEQEAVILLEVSKANIAAVINLCDTMPEITARAALSPWYRKLLKDKRVIALGMGFNNTGEDFRKKMKKGLQFIIKTKGPWLIHCFAGVDRTGFFSMVLQALMGASTNDITNDYLQSFSSMYESSVFGEVDRDDSFVVRQLLSVMGYSGQAGEQSLQEIAELYLTEKIGLSVKELEALKGKLATE